MTDLVHCKRCDAQVNPNARWIYGRWAEGTTGRFIRHGDIKPGLCPVCREPLEQSK